ncbi:putative secreted protein (Por secretion system target) [Spirosoma oryzae]|uniref:Putative secreted protein (Por secretion system target) n=1 Tax=Spirosoma oryzae TaxID=1469603 RepID=A0A2T0RPZ9_9BACT|nr:T9SS type A sorting domain-containing protein [Spirosoma oryzae]PRY23269.1 putative secreted protein (Por secretion system target) [Spirosoma oryzae]
MRALFTIIGCYLTLTAYSQTANQHVRIRLDYEKYGQYLQEATETVEAVNKVGKSVGVEYRAGKTVVLLPGFEAKTGSVFVANVRSVSANVEKGLELTAFPNPFEQITTISYYLPANGKVNLWIADSQGKLIHRLVDDQEQTAGKHEVKWDAGAMTSGVYLSVVESNQKRINSRIVKK